VKTCERKARILFKQHKCKCDFRIQIFRNVAQRGWVRRVRQPWKLAKRSSSWTAWLWRRKHLEHSKRLEHHIRRRNVTLQKVSIFNHKAVITSSSAKITYLLTPWSRVLPEKLTGSQLVKKFPAFYGKRRLIAAFTSAATCPSPEPDQSSPRHPSHCL
jgi:hypothetical protein